MVTCAIGTSSSVFSGQSFVHMRRETMPWRLLTALRCPDIRSARAVMFQPDCPGTRPSSMNRSCSSPSSAQYLPKYSVMSPSEKTSWPASTGVWVVNTEREATSLAADWKDAPAATCSRIFSRNMKAEWPSLIW